MAAPSIVFPPQREVEIGGEKHPIRHLRVRDVVEILGLVTQMLEHAPGADSGDMGALIRSSGEAVDLILRRTFPTFERWDDLGAGQELSLLEVALTEGNLLEAVRSFGPAAGRLTQAAAGLMSPQA